MLIVAISFRLLYYTMFLFNYASRHTLSELSRRFMLYLVGILFFDMLMRVHLKLLVQAQVDSRYIVNPYMYYFSMYNDAFD